MDNFQVIIEAAIAKAKSETNIKKTIQEIQNEIKAMEVPIKVSDGNIKSAIKDINKELQNTSKLSQNAFKLDESKIQAYNKIGTYISKNTKLTKDQVSRFKELQSTISNVSDKSGLDQINTRFRTISSEMELIGKTGKNAFDQLKTNMGQFLNFFYGAGAVVGAISSVQKLIGTVSELDKSYVDLQMATGKTNAEVKSLLNTYIEMGQQLGATGTEVANSASSWLKQGKSIADTNKLIKDSMILSKIGSLESADSTKYLTTITKAYKISVDDTLSVVDKLSKVDLTSATDVGGLASALNEVSANAQSLGINLDELLGYVAAIGEVSGEQMSAVGNSLNTMFSRMANIKLKRLVDPETNEDLSNTETSLRRVGIQLREDSGTFRDFSDVLTEVASNWSGYNDVTKQSIAASIAGVDHINDFKILMQTFGKATEYTSASMNSSGTAMIKFSSYEEGVEAKTKKIQASLQELASDTLDSQVIKSFLDLSNILINITDGIGIFNIALTVLAGVVGAKTTLGMTAFQGVLEKVILKFGVGKAAAETFGMALSTAIPMAGIIIGFTLLNKLIDLQITTLKEQKQALEKSNSAFEESQNNLNSINTELKTTATRIDELNAKDKLTFAEEGELQELKDITAELLLQRDIENQEAEKTATDLANTNKETYDKEFGNQTPEDLMNATGGHMTDWSLAPNLNYVLANLKDMQKVKEEIGKTQFKELGYEDFWGFNIDKLTDDGYLSKLSEYKKNILKIQDYRELTTEEQNFLDLLESQEKTIYKYTNPNKWNEIKVTDIFNTKDIEKTKEELIALAKEGKLEESTITGYANLNKAISDTDLILQNGKTSTQAFVDEIYALATSTDTTTTSTDKATESVLSLSDAMSSLAEKGKLIDSVKAEVKDLGTISTDSLNDIISKYPELESVVSQYNAGLLSTQDVLAELAQAYQTDTENYKQAVISKLGESESFYTDVVKGLPQWVKDLANAYGLDFSNYKNLQSSKLALDAEYAKKKASLAKAEAATNAIVSGSLDKDNPLRMFDVNSLDTAKQIEASMQQDFDNIDRLLGGFNSSLDSSLNIKGYTPSGSSSGSNKSDKSSKSSSSDDPYLNAYNAEKATLDHKLAMDEITEKTYYDKLEKLNNKYFKKHQKKYLEQYRQNLEEIHKGRKQLDEDSIKSQFDDNENAFNLGKKTEDEYYKTLDDLNEKYYKNNTDYADEYQSNLEKIYQHDQEKLKEAYEKKIATIDKIISKYSDLRDAINDTAEGQSGNAQILTYTEGIKSANKEIKYLENEIDKLNKKKITSTFTQEDYESQLANLQSALSDAYSSIDEFNQSISESLQNSLDDLTNAYEDNYDNMTKSLEKQKDEYADIINAQKDILQLKKDQADYEKTIADKTKDISSIESRKIELEKAANTGDREANAELQKLNEDLASKKEDLADTQSDHELDLANDALDKALDDNNKILDTKLSALQTEYETQKKNQEELYKQLIDLTSKASSYTVEAYGTALDSIVAKMSENGIKLDGNYVDDLKNAQAKSSTATSVYSVLSRANGKGSASSDLNKYVQEQGYHQLSYENMAELASIFGINGVTAENIKDDTITKNIIKQKLEEILGNSTFAQTGKVSATPNGLLSGLGEHGLVAVRDSEIILDQADSKIFENFVGRLPALDKMFGNLTAIPNLSNIVTNNTNSSPTIQVILPANTTIDNSAINNYRKFIPELTNAVSEQLMNVQRQYR